MPRATSPHRPAPGALCALLLASTLTGCARKAEPPPHILLVSVDTLRRDALRAFDPRAQALPALDELARRSARFTHAVSTAGWTLPAHASLLTGLYPHRHGAIHRRATLSPEVPTLAEALAASGYETAAFTDGGFVDHSYGLGRGFARYDAEGPAGEPAPAWLPDGGRPQPRRGSDLFSRAIAYLQHRQPGRPLFLFAHTYELHDYYRDAAEVAQQGEQKDRSRARLGCLLGTRKCTPEQWQELAGSYRQQLKKVDSGVGRLLTAAGEALKDRPTFIVLLSDHGEGLEPGHGRIHHGGRLTEDLLGVPLLIAGPDVPPGDVGEPVSLVDLTPTLLDLARFRDHAERATALDGSSLLPLLSGRARSNRRVDGLRDRTLQAEEHYYWWRDGSRRGSRDVPRRPLAVAVMNGGWWYVRGLAGEEVEAWGAAPGTSPPLEPLRRLARPVLTTTSVATAGRRESDEDAAELRALGYGG